MIATVYQVVVQDMGKGYVRDVLFGYRSSRETGIAG